MAPNGWLVTVFIICALLFLHPVAALGATWSSHIADVATDSMPMFNYIPGSPYGPEAWGTLSPQWQLCKYGQEQSPIAIEVSYSMINESLRSLQYTYMPSEGVLINVGHTVQMFNSSIEPLTRRGYLMPGSNDNRTKLWKANGNIALKDLPVNFRTGAGNLVLEDDIYELKQFHFHTPSEHVINNIRFPMEMHLVHKTLDGKKLAVIGVLFGKDHHSHFLDQFWKSLPTVTEKGANVSVGLVNFHKLHIGPSYARYRGSLTTPPCTQNVSWIVELSQLNTFSKSQFGDLKKIITEPNARPLQTNIGSVQIH